MHKGVEKRKIMNVSTFAYSNDLMFVKIVAQKMRATGKKARSLSYSNASRWEMRPPMCAVFTATAVPNNWAHRMNEGAGNLWTAYLFPINRVALHIM